MRRCKGFEVVPDLLRIVHHVGLAPDDDAAISVAACELVLEALVARKKISRSDGGQYGRAQSGAAASAESGSLRRRHGVTDATRGAARATRRSRRRSSSCALALLREYRDDPLYTRAARRRAAIARASSISRSSRRPNETMLLAERDGRVVGILRCVDAPGSPLLLPERYCYVSSVYVVPAERRRGVLRALVAAAERWCDAARHRRDATAQRRVVETSPPTCGARSASRSSKQVRRRPLPPSAEPRAEPRDARRARADARHHDLADVRLRRLRGRRARRERARLAAVRQRDGRRDRRALGPHARRSDARRTSACRRSSSGSRPRCRSDRRRSCRRCRPDRSRRPRSASSP